MKEVSGTIDHRILLNYRIDPAVMQGQLPPEFEPKLVDGYAIGGICQVSLSGMRPKGLPALAGTTSHNAAHRIAVVSSQGEGVYVPRRDTDSWLNTFSGGRVFPGVYNHASFHVQNHGDAFSVTIKEAKGARIMSIEAEVVETLPQGSVFSDVASVSKFFEGGNIGWSPNSDGSGYDAIELQTVEWRMEPLEVSAEYSSFFTDTDNFPKGSVEFDGAMIMRGLQHSWVSRDNLCELCC